ncbi:hypothetical protein GCM10010151_51420 [Actinoallomurus spadix]|uniref:Integral membrane protein n=1 Tax=Actinoallomurus spadix TaxID=79912 RepID=A0ABN0X5D6_9ACTN
MMVIASSETTGRILLVVAYSVVGVSLVMCGVAILLVRGRWGADRAVPAPRWRLVVGALWAVAGIALMLAEVWHPFMRLASSASLLGALIFFFLRRKAR